MRPGLIALFAGTMAIGAASALAQEANISTLPAARQARIDGMIRAFQRSQRIKAISVGVVVDGKLVYAKGFGEARPGMPATKDTIYPIGHITQEFTAAAVLLWQQRRYRNAPRVSVNDPLTEYFFGVAHWGGAKIANLLTHTSGMPLLSESIFYEERLYSRIKAERILQFIKGRNLAFNPGTAFRYSHSNYFLVAQIIEVGLEVFYHDFIKTDIYDQAKMSRSSFLHRQAIRQRARGYRNGKVVRDVNPTMFMGSADATSTVVDLLKWDYALLRSKMLTKLSRETLFGRFVTAKGKGASYGAGFFVRTRGGWNEYFTEGSLPGFTGINKIFHQPKRGRDTYVVILTNADGVKGLDGFANRIAAAAR